MKKPDPLDWASLALSQHSPAQVWAKLFDELREYGFSACSSCIMQRNDYALPQENHGTVVTTSFEEHIRENPSITRNLHVMYRIGASDQIIAANRLHPHYSLWNESDGNFIHYMAEFGFRGGFAASVHDPMRDKFVFITACSLTSEREANKSFDRISRLFLPAMSFLVEGIAIKTLKEDHNFQPLSIRKQECLLWVCCGLMNSAIAERTGLSEHTVQEYLRNASKKLGASTRAQAAARATLLRLITP